MAGYVDTQILNQFPGPEKEIRSDHDWAVFQFGHGGHDATKAAYFQWAGRQPRPLCGAQRGCRICLGE